MELVALFVIMACISIIAVVGITECGEVDTVDIVAIAAATIAFCVVIYAIAAANRPLEQGNQPVPVATQPSTDAKETPK